MSTTLARFQLVARRSDSRFAVTIEPKGQRGGIAPGMRVKLVVRFRGDVLDEPEETLTVNVQQGRSVIVKLCGYRDPPILRGKETSLVVVTCETYAKANKRKIKNDGTSR